ncbi:DUF4231 domain-containing protein [Actinoplanes sichuanensis]|uniref:DUF4231 domain-containing protein n=1 Tax=Actinoplanes sichuanensis TaxID=512349 RepID=A0ABW3ZZZ4_9ACTN|nr:DUF4231 domain-containing protein [Actinoplanes sichuanensis]BEL04351.1 DUF4231 domain-containing protein [Actinoplanes sichuanensis]
MGSPQGLAYGTFCRSASAASRSGQSHYLRATRVRLTALVVAAAGGALGWHLGSVDVWAWVAFVAFLTALAAELVLFATRPETRWYEARSAAESTKTLSWRYAVGGDPFPVTADAADMRATFLAQLASVARALGSDFPLPVDGGETQITADMDALRRAPFVDRKSRYLQGRIQDQRAWYRARARTAEGNGQIFMLSAIALELFGVVAAVLRAADIIDFDLLGIISAVVAGASAWAQTRQYGATARAYAVAAHELSSVETLAESVTEPGWPAFVAEAETAISREHSLWTSSRRL